jgi:quinol monooxygenase YgiN
MPMKTCCPIVELRQYTLHPGQRDVLIKLFDREFVETQEALGMHVIGQFRDLDDPNRFVWIRGFADMAARGEALPAFYGGPVWKAHREAANATMVDSDNVLLLRPVRPESGFSLVGHDRPRHDSSQVDGGLVVATIYDVDPVVGTGFPEFFEQTVKPQLTAAGAAILASFVTENSANNFPQLPIREGEHVLVTFAAFADESAYARHVTVLEHSERWQGEVSLALTQRLTGPTTVLRLSPTSRSQLRG